MSDTPEATRVKSRRSPGLTLTVLLSSLVGTACGGGLTLPPPRPLVTTSGARLSADPDTLQAIYDWLIIQDEAIQQDPSFLIEAVAAEQDTYPWETLVLAVHGPMADSARYQYTRSNPDIVDAYNVYAHLHLMRRVDRLDEWLPDLENAEGYALERALVARMADAWLLGRTTFDTQPHLLLDELIYAKQAGHLDAFIFTARPNDFAQEREAWVRENPQGLEQYRTWFRETLGGDPPGIRTRTSSTRRGG
jgi:hypothetical protein